MEIKPIPDKVLVAAKKWLKDWDCEIMYYAGEKNGLYYFNGKKLDMSGKMGFGIPISVTNEGTVEFIRQHLLSCVVYKTARNLNLPYKL